MKNTSNFKMSYQTLEVGVIEVNVEMGYAVSFPEFPPVTPQPW